MQNIIKIGLIIIAALFIINIFKENKRIDSDDPVRLRVIASSNDEQDQKIKYLVVDALIKWIEENRLDKKLHERKVQEELQNVVRTITTELSAEINYEKLNYEAKKFGNQLIPSGKYWTLVVKLGEANGKNWWSILYPEYFGLSYQERISFEEIEYRSYIYDKWIKSKE